MIYHCTSIPWYCHNDLSWCPHILLLYHPYSHLCLSHPSELNTVTFQQHIAHQTEGIFNLFEHWLLTIYLTSTLSRTSTVSQGKMDTIMYTLYLFKSEHTMNQGVTPWMNAYHGNSTRSLSVVVCMLLRTPHLSCSVLHFVILIYMYGVGLHYLSNLYIPVLLTSLGQTAQKFT